MLNRLKNLVVLLGLRALNYSVGVSQNMKEAKTPVSGNDKSHFKWF